MCTVASYTSVTWGLKSSWGGYTSVNPALWSTRQLRNMFSVVSINFIIAPKFLMSRKLLREHLFI